MPMTVAQIKAHGRALQASKDAGLPPPPAIQYAVGGIDGLPESMDDTEVYNADEPTPMSMERRWVYYAAPDPAVGKMKEFLTKQRHDEDTPLSADSLNKQMSSPGSSSAYIGRPVSTSSSLSSPLSSLADEEDYFGTQVESGQESQAKPSVATRKLSSSPRLGSEEVHPSLTQGLPKPPPSKLPDQSPSPVRETSKALKRKAESSSPAPKKRKVNTKGSDTGNSTSLRHNTVLKQEGVESEPKPLGQLARDIGHEVRKRSTRTTRKKAKKAATIKAKDNTAEDIKAENIKREDVKNEITISHQAQPSLSETEDDAVVSDHFEDAVEYMQDSLSPFQFQESPSSFSNRGVVRSIQAVRYNSTKGVTPRRISKKSEQRKRPKPQPNTPTPEAFPVLQESMGPFDNRGLFRGAQTARKSTSGKTPMKLSKKNTPNSAPDTSTPNARMTRSRIGDDAKFMALDSDNTPTSVDNILLDLESIDRQHRMMMKMRKQAKARREGRVK